MRNIAKLLVALLVSVIAVGCKPRMPVPADEALAEAELTYYWRLELILDDDERIERVQLLDENLYCMTNQNRLIAIDAATGYQRWTSTVGDPGEVVFRPYHVDDMALTEEPLGVGEIMGWRDLRDVKSFDGVIFNTVDEYMVFDRATGKEYRHPSFDFSANCGGAADREFFYVGATSGRYYCYALASSVHLWTLETDGLISAPLEYFNNRVFVAGEDHRLYSAQTGQTGELIWTQEMGGAVTAPFHVDSRGCFVSSEDGRLYAFDSMSGQPLWPAYVCEGELRHPVQVGDATLFQYSAGDGLHAVDLSTGKRRWRIPEGRAVLGVSAGRAFVMTSDGTLQVVDEILGHVEHYVSTKGLELFARNARVSAIYAVTRDGRVHCIRRKGSSRLDQETLRRSMR